MDTPEQTCRKYKRLALLFIFLILIGSTVGILVPAGPGWDFANFYDTGRRAAAGQIADIYNPESLIEGKPSQGRMPFSGAPLSSTFYIPLAWFPPESALILFKIQNTLAYFAALLLLYFHNRRFRESSPIAQAKFAAAFAFLSLIYQPFWTVYRVGGQTTATVLLLFSIALIAHTASRYFLSASLLLLIAMIKPAFAVVLLFLTFCSGLRFFFTALLLSSLTALASVLTMGWPIHKEFIGVMFSVVQMSFPWFYNSSLYVPIENLRLLPSFQADPHSQVTFFRAAYAAISIVVTATFAYTLAKSRTLTFSPAARRHFSFLMAVCFSLLISRTVWEHYLSMLFLPLAYIVASQRHFSRPALVIVGIIFVFSTTQNLIFVNLLRYTFEFDSLIEVLLIGFLKSAPLLLIFVFLLRYHQEILGSYAESFEAPFSTGRYTQNDA